MIALQKQITMIPATLKKLGNSRAFVIPSRILKKYNVRKDACIFYEEKDDHLEIHFADKTVVPAFFNELHEIAKLSGPEMTMEDIRSDRNNKKERVW